MKVIFGLAAVVVLAGCSQTQSSPQASTTPTSVITGEPTPSAPSPRVTKSVTATPSATRIVPSTEAFCDYLEQTAEAQQTVEDPQAYVRLVTGAQAVAPGAISDDLALYAQSAKKLAVTVTGSPEEAAKADAWLTRNEAAVGQAEANLNAYAESTCGRPFVAGE